MPKRTRAFTPFGMQVSKFCLTRDIEKKDLAARAGVSYAMLMEVIVGRRPGYEITAKLRDTMQRIKQESSKKKLG